MLQEIKVFDYKWSSHSSQSDVKTNNKIMLDSCKLPLRKKTECVGRMEKQSKAGACKIYALIGKIKEILFILHDIGTYIA
jgi:hypothetical protein